MRIGIDARPLTGSLTGIGRYVHELCVALDNLLPDATFFAYSPTALSVSLPSSRWQLRMPSRVPKHLGGYFWFKFLSGPLIQADELDYFFATRTLLPPLPDNVRSVSLVHDLNHVLVPGTMTPLVRLAHTMYFRKDLKAAALVVANSRGTSQRIAHWLGRPADLVVRPGVGDQFYSVAQAEIRRVSEKFRLVSPYFLSVATLEPRKNIAGLIQAYEHLKKLDQFRNFALVLAGSLGWKQGPLYKRLQAGIPGVRILGYVDDIDLPGLYAGAEAFVFPSLYEGYGIPVSEARAAGTRIVATDIPELHEASDGTATFCKTDPASIANAMAISVSRPRPIPAAPHYNEEEKRLLSRVFSA